MTAHSSFKDTNTASKFKRDFLFHSSVHLMMLRAHQLKKASIPHRSHWQAKAPLGRRASGEGGRASPAMHGAAIATTCWRPHTERKYGIKHKQQNCSRAGESQDSFPALWAAHDALSLLVNVWAHAALKTLGSIWITVTLWVCPGVSLPE